MTESTCAVAECTKPKRTRGWCGPHYQRWRRTGSETGGGPSNIGRHASADERLRNIGWTVTAAGCWEWKGARHPAGYGKLGYRGSHVPAHRLSYETYVGPIPEGLLIRHSCDNPPCINPDHLTPGRNIDNTADALERKRFANGTRTAGAKLTDEQVDEIRARRAAGESAKELALVYGVHFGHIQAIVARRFRKTPTNPPLTPLE